MHFEYSEESLLVRDTVRSFADSEVRPGVREREAAGRFPAEVLAKLGALGLSAPTVSEKYGGAGVDTLTYCLVIEEIAKVDASTSITISVNNSVCCAPIEHWGTEEQKQQFLVPCAAGEFIGGFALTEPGAGSDTGGLTTRAERVGDEWVLNGTKAWITNAGPGRLFIVMALTAGDDAKDAVTAFLVESDRPGFKVDKEEDKLGLRASKTAQIVLEDCRVPAANILGGVGAGLKVALQTLDGARIGVAAQSVGIAQGAYEQALGYAKTRESFGKRIAEHQAIGFMLADMATQIDAARLLTHRAAWLKDRGRPFKKEAAMAKLYASETANRVAYAALQVHGGYGYSKDYEIERMFRDARVTTIYEGTSEIQRFVVARELMRR